jgi:hypothetical protein
LYTKFNRRNNNENNNVRRTISMFTWKRGFMSSVYNSPFFFSHWLTGYLCNIFSVCDLLARFISAVFLRSLPKTLFLVTNFTVISASRFVRISFTFSVQSVSYRRNNPSSKLGASTYCYVCRAFCPTFKKPHSAVCFFWLQRSYRHATPRR